MLKQYCVTCHSDRAKAGGLTLASYDVAQAAEHTEITEKMIRKLRAGMMPPAGARRPEAAVLGQLMTTLENTVDRAADANRPGGRVFQRLNRAEYARAIKDLLALDIDVSGLLPADQLRHAIVIAASPSGAAVNAVPRTSMSTPATPTSIPTSSRRLGFMPNGRFITVTMTGMMPMNATINPDATVCSEYAVRPMPATSINAPSTPALRHSISVGNGRPRSFNHAISNKPATRKREPIW